jgi:hypothetical protein
MLLVDLTIQTAALVIDRDRAKAALHDVLTVTEISSPAN